MKTMDDFKGTNEPLTFKVAEDGMNQYVETLKGERIAEFYCHYEGDELKTKANAKLYSNAKDLLESLVFIAKVAKGKSNDKSKIIELRFERDTLITWLKKAETTINKAL